MYFCKKTYSNSPEFLKSEKYQNISCTVDGTDITADENGKKYVPAGTVLDADGKAVKVARSGAADSYTYTFSSAPAGILFDTVEVTHGNQPGALMIDGAVDVERLPGDYWAEAVQQLINKMPYIKFFVDGQLQIKEG